MPKIQIEIDTKDKKNSSIQIDGKKLKNVGSVHIYGMSEPDYMGIEINQYESGEEEGDLRKMTRLSASEKGNWEMSKSSVENEEDKDETRKSIAKMLLPGRQIEE